jgi:hypothetical protein
MIVFTGVDMIYTETRDEMFVTKLHELHTQFKQEYFSLGIQQRDAINLFIWWIKRELSEQQGTMACVLRE